MSDLDARAAAAGLHRHWEDATGQRQRVSDDTLAAILATLDITPPERPFVVATVGAPVVLPAGTPRGFAELIHEDGAVDRVEVGADGRLPPIYAVGYHRLAASGYAIDLAVAPPRCPAPPPGRSWGVAVQVPALRGSRPGGFGDGGALAEAARAFGRAGADALAISPTHALFPADPTRFSPYAPSSRLFHNVLLGDPALIGTPLPPQPQAALIDWTREIPARLRGLREIWDTMEVGRAAVGAWRADRGAPLEAHARFDALHARFYAETGATGWQDWPTAFHDPAGPEVQRFAAAAHDEIGFHVFLQWLAELSLAAAHGAARESMRIGLIADLAVGTDAGGSHGWSRRGELLTGLSVGAPPDPLGPRGQDWGITALDPFALKRTGFAALAETIRVALSHAGGLRIDHALGLKRLWVIPAGASANEGAYLSMPFEAMLAVIRIEAHRAGAIVIGEDLGTVPPGFRDTMAERGLLGMRVLPFERDADAGFVPPAEWDATAVAMTGTHDTPTVAGWWQGRDLDWNERLDRSDTPAEDRARRATDRAALWTALGETGTPPADAPVDAVLRHVAAAPAALMIVPVEDLLALDEQPNLPGTVDEHPNWRRRLPDTTDALLARPEVAARTDLLSTERPA